MNQAYYKKNIDYASWKQDADIEFLGGFNKESFKKVNNKTFNKYFWHIYGYNKWIYKNNSIEVLLEDGHNGKFISFQTKSFSQFKSVFSFYNYI